MRIVSVNTTSFGRLLSALDEGQQDLLPTYRERAAYYLLFGDFALIALFLAFFVVQAILGEPADWVFTVITVLFFAIVPLFILNWSLMRKIWRYADMMRKLDLPPRFLEILKSEQKRNRLVSVLASLSLFAGVIVLVIGGFLIELAVNDVRDPLELSVALAVLTGGAGLVSLRYLWSGHRRITTVARLISERGEEEGSELSRIEIKSDALEALERLERDRIIRSSQQSVRVSRGEDYSDSYVVQTSRTAQMEKAQLGATARLKVHDLVVELMNDPHPEDAREDPSTGTRVLRVPDTDIDVRFAVDEAKRRVRIHTVSVKESAEEPDAQTETAPAETSDDEPSDDEVTP